MEAENQDSRDEAEELEEKERTEVVIVDVDIPFMALFFFMLKVALASVPALIILYVIWTILLSEFGA